MSLPVVHPADRTVVVSAIQQGSGVLLTDRLVLTCAHVVKSGSVLIAHPAVSDRVRATVAWIDYRLDVALLEAVEPVRPVPPVRLGVVDTRQAIPDCEITGFPRVQRYGRDQRLEADQYTATVLPLAGRVRDLLVCDLDGPPAARPDDEPAALSGLSGGPVFMGDVLLGVARQVPQQRDGRRVECVPLGPVLAANPFRLVCRRAGLDLREERVHGSFPRDLRYEAEYAQALGAKYRRTKIFGLDELSRHDTEWDLDTAYLSLEAQAQDRAAQHPGVTEASPPLPQRIDALLADRPRVLLRGEAGAGKTTLLWWLAAHASARTLGDALAPLNGLIPFVVPLRTLRARGVTFPRPAELSGAAGLVVDTAPEGWAGRVLESGRALLLVDGLDEVPPEEREQTHTWLSQLLARYPDTRCVATVRPLAVEPDWLRSEGFAELRLLPMRNEDIQAFVAPGTGRPGCRRRPTPSGWTNWNAISRTSSTRTPRSVTWPVRRCSARSSAPCTAAATASSRRPAGSCTARPWRCCWATATTAAGSGTPRASTWTSRNPPSSSSGSRSGWSARASPSSPGTRRCANSTVRWRGWQGSEPRARRRGSSPTCSTAAA
ncbi:NACHT domain-containing protein [Streptomyces sp. SM13]|uniref:NACHT domain-containing protein n=1 Tax=Streptomyces sp. SM13 TaxID=1983803 RepID=UPI0027E56FD6|nr:NACHT domain-containing protein [Streptomyces sp. SM13]